MRGLIRRAVVVAGAAAVIGGTAAGAAGAGTAPALSWSAATTFTAQADSQTFTLTNTGGSATGALTVTASPPAFTIPAGGDACTGTSLGPHKSCTVTVDYAPGQGGAGALTAVGQKGDTAKLQLTGLTAPGAPVGLTAAAGAGSVTLNWSAPAGPAVTAYNVYEGTSPGGENTTSPVATTASTSATVNGLTDGTPYYFVVTAVNGAGQGPASGEASATTLYLVSVTVTGGAMTDLHIIDNNNSEAANCNRASSCSLAVSGGDEVSVGLTSGFDNVGSTGGVMGSPFTYTCPGSAPTAASFDVQDEYKGVCRSSSVTGDYTVTASF